MLRYRRIQSTLYTDTIFSLKSKSTRVNTSFQVFVSDKVLVAVYPMQLHEQFRTAFHWFCKQVGVPDSFVVDGHCSQTSNEVKRFCDQVVTTLKVLDTGKSWENIAELYIVLLKEAVYKDLRASNSPMFLWCYAIQRRASIHNAIPRPLFQADGKRLMYQLLDFREIFMTCAPLDGTSGYNTVTVVPSPKINKILEE